MRWVFLLKQETPLSSDPTFYDFVPYKYGPFSFTVYRDLEELARFGYLNGDGLRLQADLTSAAQGHFLSLAGDLRQEVMGVLARYGRLSQARLVHSIYEKYPWFASRSELNGAPKSTAKQRFAAYTAGYEGESIEAFLQKLLKAGIDRIVDVRNNPVSRKYGFSKGTLDSLCTNLDIR